MSESKTPRTDEIAQRHLAGCDIVTCYHYAIRLANDLETELAAVKAERDMWKANHDNQVKLKSAIMDRPDLGDRARKVTALSEQLAASHAREAQLREALRLMAEANPGVAVMPTIEAKKQNLAQRLALQALTLPPPPVVPLALAEKLADALEYAMSPEYLSSLSCPQGDSCESVVDSAHKMFDAALADWRSAK